MRNENYSFSFKELMTFLFAKKKCPSCDSRNLTKDTIRLYEGIQKNTDYKMNLGQEHVFKNTIIYKCEDCKNTYTLKGLVTNEELNEDDDLLNTPDYSLQMKVNDDSIKKRSGEIVKIIFNLCILMFIFIIVSVAIQDRNIMVAIVFVPFVILLHLLIRFFIKRIN